MRLFTIGYEKRSVESFIDMLIAGGVEVVIDIRANPYSRIKDFSKKALAAHLEKSGIEYLHAGELGSPKDLRDKVRDDDDYDYFFDKYREYLEEQAKALKTLLNLATQKTVCLLCYERDVNRCHRRAVAAKVSSIADKDIEILHL